MVDFARWTGDNASLSAVDLQVLGLLYDLEREGCHGNVGHVRTTPKLTVGRIELLLARGEKEEEDKEQVAEEDAGERNETGTDFFTATEPIEQPPPAMTVPSERVAPRRGRHWFIRPLLHNRSVREEKVADHVLHVRFGSINVSDWVGQFSDADEDDTSSDGYADSVTPTVTRKLVM